MLNDFDQNSEFAAGYFCSIWVSDAWYTSCQVKRLVNSKTHLLRLYYQYNFMEIIKVSIMYELQMNWEYNFGMDDKYEGKFSHKKSFFTYKLYIMHQYLRGEIWTKLSSISVLVSLISSIFKFWKTVHVQCDNSITFRL